ncbi:hypothetical protein FS749_006513 [Ceratobasidium sp. UAMH 11750]|nr:hypothetical protein FS749_006513 [Ceratobasidium sp. UAMH 11750]
MEKAIGYFKEAVELTSEDHPDRPRRLNSLGNSYIKRFELIGDLEDLKKASSCFDLAVTLIPDGHPDKPKCLNDSGRGHRRLFLNVGLVNDAMAALVSFERAALMSSGHPYERLKASMNWARSSKALGLSPLNAYTRALELMHHVAWLGIPVDHRYERLATDLQNLATEAMAGAIAMQCYKLALEWLEQGRCVVWRQLLELRTPLDRLMNSHPGMAKELQRVSHLLEGASMSDSSDHPDSQSTASLLEVAQRHRRLAEERERLIASIRLLPNFDDFLRPPKFASLLSGLHDGVVVVINVHSEHCDALVVQAHTHNTTHVPLKGFSYQKAERARKDLEGYLRGLGLGRGFYTSKRGTKQIIKVILAMMWYDVVQPVLGHLGINRVLPVDDLPHITWCITGPLSFLPIHAAGDYKSADTVLSNLAISSYTPNLGALNRSQPPPAPFSGILAVGHKSAVRGLNPLPGTTAELEEVQNQFSGLRCTRLEEQDANVNAVLHGMVDHSWVHIACHASQNSGNPLKSAFHLHDADLDLAMISRASIPNAQLAFLSACQTATGDSVLPDEAVYLAAGLMMAGYPTVIATSWSIHDLDAPIVARKFYEHLLEGGLPDSRKAAIALHKATAYLRQRVGTDEYGRWVPYIHIGH